MNWKKRVISFMLAVCMTVSMLPAFAAETERHTITGFVDLDESQKEQHYVTSAKPSEDEVIQKMPKTLDVYLDDSDEATSIEVSWFCVGDDYETSNDYYFQFSPKWDEDKYALSDSIELLKDTPYIGVILIPETDSRDESIRSSEKGSV